MISTAFEETDMQKRLLSHGMSFNARWPGTCIHTLDDLGHWVKLHLEHWTEVKNVKLLNRGDCCQERINGHEVWVGNKKCGTLFHKNAVNGWISIDCPDDAQANEVVISLPHHVTPLNYSPDHSLHF